MSGDEPQRSAGDAPADDASERPSDTFPAANAREVTLTLTAPSWQDARRLLPPSLRGLETQDAWARESTNAQGIVNHRCAPRDEAKHVSGAASDEPPADGSVLALVGRARGGTPLDLSAEMEECFALGDFSGALLAAELLLKGDSQHGAALRCRQESRARLECLLRSRLDAQGRVPQLLADAADRHWLSLDPRAATLLPRVDGVRDYDAVIADSGLQAIDALRALLELLDVRVIRLV